MKARRRYLSINDKTRKNFRGFIILKSSLKGKAAILLKNKGIFLFLKPLHFRRHVQQNTHFVSIALNAVDKLTFLNCTIRLASMSRGPWRWLSG